MKIKLLGVTWSFLLLLSFTAEAQVPPHKLGQICFTKQLWCFAGHYYISEREARAQKTCSCRTPYGNISGFYDQTDLINSLSGNTETVKQSSTADLKKMASEANSCETDETVRPSFILLSIRDQVLKKKKLERYLLN